VALPEYPFMDVEDYLILARNSRSARYEYLDGELRMLAGGSTYHSRIAVNLASTIQERLGDGPCCVFNSDIHWKLSESRYVCPDVTVSCDQRDQELNEMIQYPRLVVEVLSPSTETIDRGKKFFYYRECPTVQEYAMADSQSILIEVYRREEDGWKLSAFGPGSIVTLESLGVQFPIDAVYRGMKLAGRRNYK
jgi:Uma2 family endonuclease